MAINKNTSIFKILYIYNLLIEKPHTRKEIIDKFSETAINISETSINNYIKRLQACGCKIDITKQGKSKLYSINIKNRLINITQKEANILFEIKKLLFAQKDYKYIRILIEIFYSISKLITDKEVKDELLDFRYFSTLNWELIDELEKHCSEKNIIILDYILPKGGNKIIEFHCSAITINPSLNRLYLYGILKGGQNFFSLPIDRIYMVKKIVKKNCEFNIPKKTVEYKISKKMYNQIGLDKNETLVKEDKEYAVIKNEGNDDFLLLQRFLYFCPEIYDIYDDELKKKFTETLQNIKNQYDE